MLTELKTILDVIRYGATQFNANQLYFGHGTENALDEARWIALCTLKLPVDCDHHWLQSDLLDTEKNEILELFQRRIKERLPAAYLLKEAYFCGLTFFVDERVLIPRSPLAELIEQGFEPWYSTPASILDMCTGSGCIAIAAAIACPWAEVTAVDLSKDALNVAKINVEKYQVGDRLHLLESNLFSALGDAKYDVIVSNPPYVSTQEMATLPAEYHHEPRLALHAEEEGLALVDTLLKQAANHLTPEGVLIIEVGNSQEALEERYPLVPWKWLTFEQGGEGVFMLTRSQLQEAFG